MVTSSKGITSGLDRLRELFSTERSTGYGDKVGGFTSSFFGVEDLAMAVGITGRGSTGTTPFST